MVRKLYRSQRGQAVVELALVTFLFFIFLTGVTQLVAIGTAHIQCQLAVRRAAWLWNETNNATLNRADMLAQIQSLLPGIRKKPAKISGDRERGMTFEVRRRVPSLGLFRALKPDGFELTARSAVIAYNPAPKAAQGLNELWEWVNDLLP